MVGLKRSFISLPPSPPLSLTLAAVVTVIDLLGMQPIDQTQNVQDRATTHTLLLAGIFVGGVVCHVRCRMAYDPSSGVTMEVAARSSRHDVSERIANAIN